MTYLRKKRKIQDDKIIVSKKDNYTPSLTLGASVFRERKPAWKFWSRGKDICILMDGSPKALTLDPKDVPALNLQFGTKEETTRFISKVVAKSKADQKPITNMQFMMIAMLLVIVVVLQVMAMRGATI
jgi:hypothetical protein